MNVNDAMVTNVFTCTPDAKMDSVARMMWDNDCGSIPVVDEANIPVGIITDRDIAMGSALQHKPLWDITAQSICNHRQLYSCKMTDDIHKAVDIMMAHSVRRLLVTDRKGRLAGIVSLGDILACTDAANGAGLKFGEMAGMLKAVSAHHTLPRLSGPI